MLTCANSDDGIDAGYLACIATTMNASPSISRKSTTAPCAGQMFCHQHDDAVA